MDTKAIGDLALLSDCQGAAIVDRAGSIVWLCLPRFDSPAVLGRLLDPGAGHWSIAPVEEFEATRRYLDGTMVLETTFHTATGSVVLTDALALGAGVREHDIGSGSPHVLLRQVRGLSGSVAMRMSCAPRPEYGLVRPLVSLGAGGAIVMGGPDVLTLSATEALETLEALEVERSTVTASFTIATGASAAFSLQRRSRSDGPAQAWSSGEIGHRLEDTIAGWRSWSDQHQSYEGPWRNLVHHSGLVLQALTYQPTGAIVAAATTSLPEAVGGNRNWDYRYTWVRDASFTLDALWVAACPHEANGFFSFIARSAAAGLDDGADLQIMFGVGGEHDLAERELSHLAGWRHSQPVRVGNGAWNQKQLDVYGELLSAAARLPHVVDQLDEPTRHFLVGCAHAAAARWTETDQGIWEVRTGPAHFTYSKLMCWVALDRAIAMAQALRAEAHVSRWELVRSQISDAIARDAWSDRAGAYTQSFGSHVLDASVLMMPIVGFVDPRHPRMLATLDAIERSLTDVRGLVYRYLEPDGLEGDEGSFLLCTFWLAHARALAGEVEHATEIFERAVRYVNDVGLLAEEVDARTGELLGNFPQAFSHIGLINAAWAISQARGETFPGLTARG